MPLVREKVENLGLPALDPFTYDSVTFDYKGSELLGGTFTVRDVKTYGMSRGKVLRLKSNITDDTMSITAEVMFPKLFSTGDYTADMSFNAFKLASKGQYNVTMKDVIAKWNIKGKVSKIDGEDYMKIIKFDIIPDAKDMKLSVSGLFPDPALSKNQRLSDFSKLE